MPLKQLSESYRLKHSKLSYRTMQPQHDSVFEDFRAYVNRYAPMSLSDYEVRELFRRLVNVYRMLYQTRAPQTPPPGEVENRGNHLHAR